MSQASSYLNSTTQSRQRSILKGLVRWLESQSDVKKEGEEGRHHQADGNETIGRRDVIKEDHEEEDRDQSTRNANVKVGTRAVILAQHRSQHHLWVRLQLCRGVLKRKKPVAGVDKNSFPMRLCGECIQWLTQACTLLIGCAVH